MTTAAAACPPARARPSPSVRHQAIHYNPTAVSLIRHKGRRNTERGEEGEGYKLTLFGAGNCRDGQNSFSIPGSPADRTSLEVIIQCINILWCLQHLYYYFTLSNFGEIVCPLHMVSYLVKSRLEKSASPNQSAMILCGTAQSVKEFSPDSHVNLVHQRLCAGLI